MRNILHLLRKGMEERVDGKAETELEHIVYARLTDFTQLSNAASKELQEQWMIKVPKTEKNAGAGSCRVRKSQIEGADANYFFTTKVKKGEDKGSLEATLPCSEDMYNMYRFLADEGMVKDRYRFPIQGSELVWEVDVFKKADGSYHEWVKIDLEVTNAEEALPELPMQFAEVILPEDLKGPDQEKHNAVLDTLYTSVFKTPNQFVSGEVKEKLEKEQASQPADGTDVPADGETGEVGAGDGAISDGAVDPAGNTDDKAGTTSDEPGANDDEGGSTGVVVENSDGSKPDGSVTADGSGEETEKQEDKKVGAESLFLRF